MKNILRLLLSLSVGVASAIAASEVPNRSPEEIEKLVSPIALYPDSLVAIILPAATESADVVLAARFLSNGGQESDIDKQFWHDTVKSLAHYPDVVKWMDENLEWTQQMGEVFGNQPTDVMAAIQRLRVHARENGLLADTPQQRVVVEQEVVYIVPADPACIYIPRYDPDILWTRSSFRGSFITFSVGFGVGNWLFYDCDWPGRTIWVHRRHPGWVYTPFWRPPPPSVRVNVVTEWHPSTHYFHRSYSRDHRPPSVVVVPRPWEPDHHYHPSGPGPDRHGNWDRGPNRPTPPGQHFPGRPPVTMVSPVAPVSPMTHPGVVPSSPAPNSPPRENNPWMRHNSPRVGPPAPPVPPSHESQIRSSRPNPSSAPTIPGAGTATLRRPPPTPPSHQPTMNTPPPAPPTTPRPSAPPPNASRPRNTPPAQTPQSSGNGSSDSNNSGDDNGRRRHGH